MCVGGEWGTVCADRYWNDNEARVACRQLGLPSESERDQNHSLLEPLNVELDP